MKHLQFDCFIHCILKIFVNGLTTLTFFSFQGVDSHFNYVSRDVAGSGGLEEVSHLRGCKLPSVEMDFSKVLSTPPLQIITLFRGLKIKGPLKEL